MKVSLTYQIDFDRIPEEVAHFLERIQNDLYSAYRTTTETKYSAGSGVDFLSTIVKLHESLGAISEQFDTIESIVLGYEKALLQLQVSNTQEPALEEEGEKDQIQTKQS